DLEPRRHALDLVGEPLVDDEDAGPRLLEDAGERVAAKAGVHPEERRPDVATAAVEGEQLEVVLEHHRDVRRPRVVDRAEPTPKEVGDADAFVAVALVRPR